MPQENKNVPKLHKIVADLDAKLTNAVDLWQASQELTYTNDEPMHAAIVSIAEHLNYVIEIWHERTLHAINNSIAIVTKK